MGKSTINGHFKSYVSLPEGTQQTGFSRIFPPVRSGDRHRHFPIFLGVLTGDPQHLRHNRYKFKYETAIFLDDLGVALF